MDCLEITLLGWSVSYISLFSVINMWFDGKNFEMLCCSNFDLFILKEETTQSILRQYNTRWSPYYFRPNQTNLYKHSSDPFHHSWPSLIWRYLESPKENILMKQYKQMSFRVEGTTRMSNSEQIYFKNTEEHSLQ